MAKNTNSLTHLLMVIGIVFTLQAEAGTDSIIQPEKCFEPTISIQSRFEIAGDTVTIPVELGTPLASISGFQFKLNTTPPILDFIQVETGDSIADDTTWQVFGLNLRIKTADFPSLTFWKKTTNSLYYRRYLSRGGGTGRRAGLRIQSYS